MNRTSRYRSPARGPLTVTKDYRDGADLVPLPSPRRLQAGAVVAHDTRTSTTWSLSGLSRCCLTTAGQDWLRGDVGARRTVVGMPAVTVDSTGSSTSPRRSRRALRNA